MAAIRFRIDGVLHQVYQVPAVVMIAMTARIKLLGRMDVIEKRRPQDGRIKTRTAGGQEVELRLSTLPTAFGEKLVMRIFDPDVVVKTLPELGFPEDDAERWDALTQRPHGIILVTGPTGSGKTTTLYTTLKALATPRSTSAPWKTRSRWWSRPSTRCRCSPASTCRLPTACAR
jgi:general secretion pathway protein E